MVRPLAGSRLSGREHETQLFTIIDGGADQPLIETRQ